MWGKGGRKANAALDQAYDDFADRFTVAFLGTRRAGKTVHCALLKDAAVRHLKRHTNGKYLGVATAGAGRINEIVDALHDGRFPEKTAGREAVQLAVEISSTENGTDIDLIFHDMAGGEHDELLVAEMPAEDRVRQVLEAAKIDGKPYGLMAHIIFAKIYVMLVDCTEAGSWGGSQAYIKEAIRGIYGIKKHIHALYNGRIPSHLAIVFSKCDTLEGGREADELAKDLDEVDAAITKYIAGSVQYFRSSLDSTEMGRHEAGKIDAGGRLAAPDAAEGGMKACKASLARAKSCAGPAKAAPSAATARLDEARPAGSGEPINSRQAEYGKAQREHGEAARACAEHGGGVSKARAEIDKIRPGGASAGGGAVRYKPNRPLSYNTDEYLDLISWMIKMARSEARY